MTATTHGMNVRKPMTASWSVPSWNWWTQWSGISSTLRLRRSGQDTGLPWKRIPSGNRSQQLISSQIWICRIMTAWHIMSFPGSVMMGVTPWPSKSSQTLWYSLQRESTTAGIKLTRFHYD